MPEQLETETVTPYRSSKRGMYLTAARPSAMPCPVWSSRLDCPCFPGAAARALLTVERRMVAARHRSRSPSVAELWVRGHDPPSDPRPPEPVVLQEVFPRQEAVADRPAVLSPAMTPS